MTAAEQREKARLRSERWRRAHGIGPRKPAPGAFYFAFPPSRIRPRVQDLANMRLERPRRPRR